MVNPALFYISITYCSGTKNLLPLWVHLQQLLHGDKLAPLAGTVINELCKKPGIRLRSASAGNIPDQAHGIIGLLLVQRMHPENDDGLLTDRFIHQFLDFTQLAWRTHIRADARHPEGIVMRSIDKISLIIRQARLLPVGLYIINDPLIIGAVWIGCNIRRRQSLILKGLIYHLHTLLYFII